MYADHHDQQGQFGMQPAGLGETIQMKLHDQPKAENESGNHGRVDNGA